MSQSSSVHQPLSLRRARARLLPLLALLASLVASLLILGAGSAAAATSITSNITEDTTWTKSGSPYMLNRSVVQIGSAATLTIEAGVTVAFNYSYSQRVDVYGAIKALGSSGEPVVFTSSQALEGLGAPGQYMGIRIKSGDAASRFSYAEFHYGAYGGTYNSGAIFVEDGSTIDVEHGTFEHNDNSGIWIDTGTANVSHSTFADNKWGATTGSGASVLNLDHSTLSGNSSGVFITKGATEGSYFTYNTIVDNAGHGIRFDQECTEPVATFPHGEYNNIFANGPSEEPERQLRAYYRCQAKPVNWRNNYWGGDVFYHYNDQRCDDTGTPFPGHLAYTWSSGSYSWEAPKGPIRAREEWYGTYPNIYACIWDTVEIGPNEFLKSPVEGAPEPPSWVFSGEGGPLFAPYLPTVNCADPVNCITGNFHETRTDLRVPGLNEGLTFARTYNALAAKEGAASPLGHGWSHTFGESLELDPSETSATITNADGSRVTFTEEEGAFTAPAWVQATLVRNEDGSFTYTLPDRRAFEFSAAGILQSIADRNGNQTTLSYTEGKLTAVTDPSERQLSLAYDEAGRIESVTSPAGRKATYAYGEAGDLTSVTAPGEVTESYAYDSEHLMTQVTDPREGKTTNVYDEAGRVTSQTDPLERETTWTYNAADTQVTLPNESVTKVAFAENLPTEITYAHGSEDAATVKYEYDEDLYPVSRTDANGNETTFGYDAAGNRTARKDALGNETTWAYDAKRQVVSTTTPKGEKTTIERDAAGNPTSVSRPAPGEATQTTSLEYDEQGLPEGIADPLERSWSLEYGSHGELTAVSDPLGQKQTMAYDEDSRLTSVTSPRGNLEGAEASQYTTTIERDAQGRPIKVTDPLGNATEYAWDANGNLLSRTSAKERTTKYTYNAADERTKVEKPNGAVLQSAYDALGDVVSQTDAKGQTTTYVRDALGRAVEVVDPLERKASGAYDDAGNLTSFTDAAGRTTTFTYDAANRLTKADFSEEATADVEATYDADGNLTATVDGTGESSFAYDQLGRLTEAEDGHEDVVGYEYDLAEQLTGITYPNGKSIDRGFDEAGRLASVTDWLENTTSFAYDADYNLTATTFPEGTGNVDEYAYDRAGQMSEASFDKGAETLASLSYVRDKLGQLESLAGAGLPGPEELLFGYDENERLTEAGEASFEYDAADNLTKAPGTTNAYDAANQLEAGTGLTYAYDKLGQRTKTTPEAGAATSYGYDQAGGLVSVERAAEGESPAIEVGYAYDASGLIASRTSGETTSYLTWDVNAELPLLLSDGQNSYIYGPHGLPVEHISGEAPTYYHHDQLGSTRLLTDASGEALATFTYTPYGTLEGSTGTATTPLGFAGQYTDPETGLQFLRARFYDPATGQFMSRDPIEALTREPYAYAANNPVNMVDPTGLDPISDLKSFVEPCGPVQKALGMNSLACMDAQKRRNTAAGVLDEGLSIPLSGLGPIPDWSAGPFIRGLVGLDNVETCSPEYRGASGAVTVTRTLASLPQALKYAGKAEDMASSLSKHLDEVFVHVNKDW